MVIPGVHAVITADDLPEPMRRQPMPMLLPNPAISAPRTQLALARDEVCYVGQAVAVVIAETRYIAEDAAMALIVHYDVLAAAGDCREAVKENAPARISDLDSNAASTFRLAYGNIDAAFAGAPHVFEEEIWQHRGGGMALETRAVLASHDAATDLLTVWSGTQTPHIGRRMLADLLGRELESIRMIAPDVGGGFGPKAIFYPEEAVIPAVALKLGRPVKWIEDRREHFLSATQERDQYWSVAIAVDARRQDSRRARQHAARQRRVCAVGHHHALYRGGDRARPVCRSRLSARTLVVLTNKVPTTPVRGAGRPQAVFAMERLMDRVAQRASTRSRRGAPPQFHQARADAV